jgi:membrane protease YdiL (CAAX protease family)
VGDPAAQADPAAPADPAAEADPDAQSDAAAQAQARWSPWTAPLALLSGVVLAALGGVVIDIPALALGVKVSGSHVPPGLVIADTAVQDAVFVAVAVFFAQLGGRRAGAWQLGLRARARDAGLVLVLLAVFVVFSAIWGAVFHSGKEKLLEQLGTRQSAALLILSAVLTCVIAPVSEEVLFRGYIFSALRNWRGPWLAAVLTGLVFGAVHAGSAPAVDLLPLAALGFGLCLLYRATGSLYPCIAAHAINNTVAFGSLEDWGWQIPLLTVGALALITLLALALTRARVIAPEPAPAPGGAAAAAPVPIPTGGYDRR